MSEPAERPIEISVAEARAGLAEVVNRALAGQVTYLLRHGQRVAIVAPVDYAPPAAQSAVQLGPTPPDPDEYLPEAREVAALIPDDAERSATLATLSAVQGLPARQRAVAALHFLGGSPVSEIAELLQISPATARVHLFHARRALTRAVGEPVWPIRVVAQDEAPAAERDSHPATTGAVVATGSPGWAQQAACRSTDVEALFVRGAAQNRAKLVCMDCPVRTECLADALDHRVEFGVWGGMTERERRALLRRRPDVRSWRALLEEARQNHAATADGRPTEPAPSQ